MRSDKSLAVLICIGAIELALHFWRIPWTEKLRIGHFGLELELLVEITAILIDLV